MHRGQAATGARSGHSDRDVAFEIGGLAVALALDRPLSDVELRDSYAVFRTERAPDSAVTVRFGDLPPVAVDEGSRLFDSEALWTLYRREGGSLFTLKHALSGEALHRLAFLDQSFATGEVFALDPTPGRRPGDLLANPLESPLFQLLLVCLLARRRGLLVHASAVADGERGLLFVGPSGAGKTTMTELWAESGTVLCDDRVVLRFRQGRLWAHGTPWHGDNPRVSACAVPLDKVFFLRRGGEGHRVERLRGTRAAATLFASSFAPMWDEQGLRSALDFCARLVDEVPCYLLSFDREEGVVEYLRCVD